MTARVFHCTDCGRVINTEMVQCKYCGVSIDRKEAEAAADLEERVNLAGYKASLVLQLGLWMPVGLLMGLIPFIGVGLVGIAGFLVLLIAVPIAAGRWFQKFSDLKTDHPDFRVSRRKVMFGLAIWGFFALLAFLRILALIWS